MNKRSDRLFVYTDGGARGNPGPAAIGVIILDENKEVIKKHKAFLGKATNNQAEYNAVIHALRFVKSLKAKQISFFLDSELVCRQIKGEYNINNPELKILNGKVHELIAGLKIPVSFYNVPRENEYIQQADALVNEALDEQEN
ncbi:MAG: ribonuclease HI family protein [Candidatus Pacearchaeota archaeon]|nr:ribonuclease HI family protein [Candidatus Pacearchaeota archaeon]